MHDDTSASERALPSKSQRKREAHAAQAVGERLVALHPARLARLDLPEALREAVEQTHRMHSRSARKRQLQLIGKLMRQYDWQAIEAELDRQLQPERHAREHLHACERWRERLLEQGDTALAEFLARHPHQDRQRLRQLIRNARRERQREAVPKSARELFRLIDQALRDSEDQEKS